MAECLLKMIGVVFIGTLIFGLSSCANHTYYYRISAVILNHNYTTNILDKESVARTNLSMQIMSGLKTIYTMASYKLHKGELKDVKLKDIYFGSPSHPEPANSSLITKEKIEFEQPEIGLYFLLIVQLDFNITKPQGSEEYVHNIRQLLDSIIQTYLTRVVVPRHWLGKTILLNVTTLDVEELLLTQARRMVDILKYKNHFVSTFLHQTVISENNRDALSIISYIGCGFSIIGLAITIVTIVLTRKLRRLRANQILLQLCVSLLGALLFYSFGIRQVKDPSMIESCKAVSALLHYFILASMIWASIEAYNLYQDLVKGGPMIGSIFLGETRHFIGPVGFGVSMNKISGTRELYRRSTSSISQSTTYTVFDTSSLSHNEFMCRASVVGWVPPGIIVGATVLISDTSYGFHVPDINNKTLCWLKQEAFYGAFLSPVLVLVLANMVIFVIVMREIFKMPQAHEKHSKLSQFRATISVFILLGLNWVFAGLAATHPVLVLQYLFTITCSFQGFFIFILHGFLKKDFREAWTNLTTNNRVMEILRTSHSQSQKTHSSSLSNNSLVNSSSQPYGQQRQVTFNRMADMDSGIDVHQKHETV